MIKKIIACLTICFIITGIISPVFSDASALPQPNWSDPGISEIINISDLTGWMLNGGTFDVSTYTDSESFMNDYFNSRTQKRLVSPSEDPQDDYYEVLPGFGINNQLVAGETFANPLDTNRVIASSFRDHTGYGRRLSNEVNEALLSSGSLYDTKIPLLNEIEFANFVGYNHDALRLYTEFFNNESPSPGPNPDPDFSYISRVSTYDIKVRDANSNWHEYNLSTIPFVYNRSNLSTNQFNKSLPFTVYGIFNQANQGFWNIGYNSGFNMYFFDSGRIDLTTNNDDSVTASYSGFNYKNAISISNSYNSAHSNRIWFNSEIGDYIFLDSYSIIESNITNDFQINFAGLSTAINYIDAHFRYIDLYVDGILWSTTNNNSESNTLTPEFPDAVGGEDLPTTTWPISRPRAPYYTSVPGVLQAIEDAIADDGKLDIDDLKPYLTDENGDPVPDPIFDPEPVPIPVPDPVNPDIVPGLPVLPAIPPEMPGFNGVSVLAEIINFTNQSLPTALIITFWGIVFGIVILGLIKILHK